MNWNWNTHNKEKSLFKTYHCSSCHQSKPCGVLGMGDKCCSCYFKDEQEKAQEYLDYQTYYQQAVKKEQQDFQQLLLLKNYKGCPQCGSLEVDAYDLYVENKLVCQPCLVRKTGSSSSPISFTGKQKWYKKYWGIDLVEWLEIYSAERSPAGLCSAEQKFRCHGIQKNSGGTFNKVPLPVDADCARKWLVDNNHLDNCNCLEKKAQELVELFANSLKKKQELLKNCSCKKSEKFRVGSDKYTWCEKCEKTISVASKKRVVKNRNDPRFWGLSIQEKVLCLSCLGEFQEKMPVSKQYTFNKYVKRYEEKR